MEQRSSELSTGQRWFAQAISIVFHPLFLGVFIAAFLIFGGPYLFQSFTAQQRMRLFMMFTNNNLIFPLLVVGLLKGLGFSSSIILHTQKERIVPYMATTIFFFWTYYVLRNQTDTPRLMVEFCRGLFFTSAAALLFNNYFKISMHGMGVGTLWGVWILGMVQGYLPLDASGAIAIGLGSVILVARRMISDHNWFELIAGVVVGAIAQCIGIWL
ncbi:MAG: hypothetical protein FJX83_07880 [Bacteroidetes bacterium]|nr:hypothetical protein [Bacteroidota bacterium]